MSELKKNVFGLLIGIDEYDGAPLKGCINDSEAVKEYLQHTVHPDFLHIETLWNKNATKANISNGFLSHLAQAKAGDVVFVHYSGHGSYEPADPIFWDMTPNRTNEVMVTVDSLSPYGLKNPMADKELRWLINQIAKNNAHIVMIMDCCHSGSGTRSLTGVRSRYTAAPTSGVRGVDDFVFAQAKYGGDLAKVLTPQNQFFVENGRHILLSGCRNNQTAKELNIDGKQRGIFTYSMLDILKNSGGNVSYRDIVRRATARVVNTVSEQVPQLDAIVSDDASEIFLQGAARRSRHYYIMTQEAGLGWVIDAGQVHGIVENSVLAVFAANEGDSDTARPKMQVIVERALPEKSVVSPEGATPTEESYTARMASTPLPKLRVAFLPEKANERQKGAIALLKQALAGVNGGMPSLYVEETTRSNAQYLVIAYEHNGKERYRIIKPDIDRPVLRQEDEFTFSAAFASIKNLEHIAKWHTTANLNNPGSAIVAPKNVQLELFEKDEQGKDKPIDLSKGEVQVSYRFINGQWVPPKMRIRLTNNADIPLYCAIVQLKDNFEAKSILPPNLRLDAKSSIYAFDNKYFNAKFPDELAALGVSETRSMFKLIVSTNEFEATLLDQPGLQYATTTRSAEAPRTTVKVRNTLEMLMQKTNKRFWELEEEQLPNNDWTSEVLAMCLQKPLIANTELKSEVGTGASAAMVIKPHKTFGANFFLSALQAFFKRDINSTNPTALLNNPNVSEPVAFMTGRGGSAQLNMLELSNMSNAEAITPKKPLEIELPISLGKNECIIPFAIEGDLIYPIGFAKRFNRKDANGKTISGTKVLIERLPVPSSTEGEQKERGLFNTAKIVFQKIIGTKLGIEYRYPYLAAVSKDDKGNLVYDAGISKVRQLVQSASRIAVFMHGFTGETRHLLKSNPQNTETPCLDLLASNHDLVLAFDYDSYSTSIETTAADLQKRLSDIGLTEGHGKKLIIVAHSIGGLVSRYFVEKMGGASIVRHLVMLGTPNGGTPLPKMAEWAALGLSLALSQITIVGWPLTIINLLGDKVKTAASLDEVTEQLSANSQLLKELDTMPDPKIPYTIVSGNVGLIEQRKGNVATLLKKIGLPQDSHDRMMSLFFGGEANDWVVSQASMQQIDAKRTPPIKVIDAACDHLTYFSSEAGLNALAEALKQS